MCNQSFIWGIGIGMAAGAAAAMVMMPSAMPKHKKVKRAAEKAMRTIGEAVENFTDTLSM